ncbi:MAG: ankyrin repeat domain-containing protein [Planctomycetota bacterium]
MAHQPGWIELYEILERGAEPPPGLVATCRSSRTGLGETMLHWYAIEGEPEVLRRLVALGFAVDVTNTFGRTPIMECAQIGRWDCAEVLREAGADLTIRDDEGLDFFELLDEHLVTDRPAWARR